MQTRSTGGQRSVLPHTLWAAVAALVMLGPVYVCVANAQTTEPQPHWVGVWGASPIFPIGPELSHQTIRQVVRLSLGGHAVRIRLSDELGAAPLVIGAARLAKPGPTPGSIDPATDHVLTFGGRPSCTLLPGSPAVSDPVNLDVQPLENLTVSLFVPRDTGPSAIHPVGSATAYLSTGDDQTGAPTLHAPTTSSERFFLTGVAVDGPAGSAVVTLGDSITDGANSTPNTNHRWPDYLADRIAAAHLRMGVVNAGISGNRILHDLPEAQFGPAALSRLDRDVLSVPSVGCVILMEGINDIGHSGAADLPDQNVSADDITSGMRQLIDRAHAHGIRILGATLTPFADTVFTGFFSAEGEAKRQAVNSWIRTSHAFDGVIDFDAAVRDPAHPDHLAAAYDSGDHLHPNDAGYQKMGEAIDLSLLQP